MNPLLSIPNYFIDRIVKTTATTVAEFAVNKINENRYAELFGKHMGKVCKIRENWDCYMVSQKTAIWSFFDENFFQQIFSPK